MVKFRQAPPGVLLEPSAPPWAQRFALRLQSYFVAAHPTAPTEVYAADKADLPPPADWRGCLAVVPDVHALVVSDGVNWLTVTLGGPV
jgi:hypothetical protein